MGNMLGTEGEKLHAYVKAQYLELHNNKGLYSKYCHFKKMSILPNIRSVQYLKEDSFSADASV